MEAPEEQVAEEQEQRMQEEQGNPEEQHEGDQDLDGLDAHEEGEAAGIEEEQDEEQGDEEDEEQGEEEDDSMPEMSGQDSMPESSSSDSEEEGPHGRGRRARTLAAVDTILSEPFVTGPGPQVNQLTVAHVAMCLLKMMHVHRISYRAMGDIMTLLAELVTPHKQASTWQQLHGLVMSSRPEVVTYIRSVLLRRYASKTKCTRGFVPGLGVSAIAASLHLWMRQGIANWGIRCAENVYMLQPWYPKSKHFWPH